MLSCNIIHLIYYISSNYYPIFNFPFNYVNYLYGNDLKLFVCFVLIINNV